MSRYTDWMDDQKGKKAPVTKSPSGVRIDGRWIYYTPTIYPSHEVKEWGGRWVASERAWRLPKLGRYLLKIQEYDPKAHFQKTARDYLGVSWDPELDEDVIAELQLAGAAMHPHFEDLYGFQKQSVHALVYASTDGMVLALSPGLGKTPTSIIAAEFLTHSVEHASHRVLVCCPLPLVHNWMREIDRWAKDKRAELVHGGEPTPDRTVFWTVTNYSTLMERVQDPTSGRWSETGNLDPDWDFDWDVVIFDESVLLKNRKSKRSQMARTLARSAKKVIMLSGAPITRDNSDIWSQFNILEPEYFSSFWRFANEFCVVVQTPWSSGEIQGSRHGIEVREEYPEMMFVRNQEQVLPDLPEYIFQDVELELTKRQRKAHDDLVALWMHELEENRDKRVDVTVVIAQLMRLQQVTSNLFNLETTGTPWPDESCKADWVEQEIGAGELTFPVLVWTHHRPGARALFDRLTKLTKKKDSALYKRRVELVYGGVKNSDKIIEEYKAGKIDVLILGIQVGKYGHTLVNTRTVIAYDKTWDSDAWFQMIHRVRRNGLKHRPVFITLRCRRTVDDYIELNLAGKLPPMASMTGADMVKVLRTLGEEHADPYRWENPD